jgi:hypothetical protein
VGEGLSGADVEQLTVAVREIHELLFRWELSLDAEALRESASEQIADAWGKLTYDLDISGHWVDEGSHTHGGVGGAVELLADALMQVGRIIEALGV